MKEVPWNNIFFTGLIRDEHGQKMSKSKGNGIEPGEMLKKYGADALRLGLVMGASPGNDLNLAERKIEGYSRFINKLWNAAKLIEMKAGSFRDLRRDINPATQTSRWMLSELGAVQKSVIKHMQNFEISIAADELYNYSWQSYCDWYLESMKVVIDKGDVQQAAEAKQIALLSFEALLTMLHPFIPFVTHEIYRSLGGEGLLDCKKLEMLPAINDPEARGLFARIMALSNAVRSVKAVLGIPHKEINIALSSKLSAEGELLLKGLARVAIVEAAAISEDRALKRPVLDSLVICEVENRSAYQEKLKKDLAQNESMVSTLKAKLSGSFATQAKPEVVEKEREKLAQAESAVKALNEELSLIG
jgi:valyl-tRNA synthetase